MDSKSFSKIGLIIIFLFLAAGIFVVKNLPSGNLVLENYLSKGKITAKGGSSFYVAGWETYTKEEFKIEFQHPPSLALKYEAVAVPKQLSGKKILTAFFSGDLFELTLVVNALGAQATTAKAQFIEEKTIDAGGIKANRKVFLEPDGKIIPIVGFTNNAISYSFWATIAGKDDDKIAAFDKILSTFKFFK
ncbi:MAG: hypothetical protein Q7K28_02780 [Candidatus Wildermuthbacteria bacterium]|nr:hypothetical protein [Candidatus Wildermuthbacteria bacterium]